MVNVRIALRGAALASVAAMTLAACGGGSSGGTNASSGAPSSSVGAVKQRGDVELGTRNAGTKGGTLTMLTNDDRIQDLDPQRNYTGEDLAFAHGLHHAFADVYQMSTDAAKANTIIPDAGDRHRHALGRRQDLEVHAPDGDQVAGRLARHLRGHQVRRLAHLRDSTSSSAARRTRSQYLDIPNDS